MKNTKGGVHEGIRKVHVPLTKRVLDAHVQDLSDWAEQEPHLKEEYLARVDRLKSLFKRINKPVNPSPAVELVRTPVIEIQPTPDEHNLPDIKDIADGVLRFPKKRGRKNAS